MTGGAASLADQADKVKAALLSHIDKGGRLAVVKAPPGSGKTRLLTDAVQHCVEKKRMRVAVATFTNGQADDICRRLSGMTRGDCVRFLSASGTEQDLGEHVTFLRKLGDMPEGPCVAVGTTAKWGAINFEEEPFDILFLEEAWQCAWAEFMLLGQVTGRFVLIGDPGQIPPVVSIEVLRWETSPRAPHLPAPQVIIDEADLGALILELPGTRRLPHDTAELVRGFYDFDFGAFSRPGDRFVRAAGLGSSPIDQVIKVLDSSTIAALTLPTPEEGPPLEKDDEVAQCAADIVSRLLERKAVFGKDGKPLRLEPEMIGICSTHRTMNSAIALALPFTLRHAVSVDTPERWQGLEREVMIIPHPLSGVERPSSFDLHTGRLCVMASRHKSGLIILSRDHVAATLEEHFPAADQAVGRPDITGAGHARNLAFWKELTGRKSVVRA